MGVGGATDCCTSYNKLRGAFLRAFDVLFRCSGGVNGHK
jgi:hypothetical protein